MRSACCSRSYSFSEEPLEVYFREARDAVAASSSSLARLAEAWGCCGSIDEEFGVDVCLMLNRAL